MRLTFDISVWDIKEPNTQFQKKNVADPEIEIGDLFLSYKFAKPMSPGADILDCT